MKSQVARRELEERRVSARHSLGQHAHRHPQISLEDRRPLKTARGDADDWERGVLIAICRPTIPGSDPNRRVQRSKLSTATGLA